MRAHLGLAPTPPWLDSDALHGYLLGRPVDGTRSRQRAMHLYAALVDQPREDDARFWQGALRHQVFLGDEAFVQRMQAQAEPQRLRAATIPKAQRKPPATWARILAACEGDRGTALTMAYRQAGMTMTALARETGLSVSHVSRLIAAGKGVRGA